MENQVGPKIRFRKRKGVSKTLTVKQKWTNEKEKRKGCHGRRRPAVVSPSAVALAVVRRSRSQVASSRWQSCFPASSVVRRLCVAHRLRRFEVATVRLLRSRVAGVLAASPAMGCSDGSRDAASSVVRVLCGGCVVASGHCLFVVTAGDSESEEYLFQAVNRMNNTIFNLFFFCGFCFWKKIKTQFVVVMICRFEYYSKQNALKTYKIINRK